MYINGEEINNLCDISIYKKKYLTTYSSIKKYIKTIIYINETSDQEITDILNNNKNIFFIKMDNINYFISKILPKISKPFILVTHNGDLSSGNKSQITKNPLLIKWYGQNMSKVSDKTEGIPIGLENKLWKRVKFNIIDKFKNNDKTHLLYLNFNVKTHKSRENIMNKLSEQFTKNNSKSWDKYIEELSTYKFAISPRGNGVDCHRTWEALYLGVIPIVQESTEMSYFKELPILYVKNYDQINEDYLNQQYELFKEKKFNLDKLSIKYWSDRIII